MAPDTQGEPLLKPAGHGTKPSFVDPSLPLAVVVARTRWDEPPRMRHQVTRQLMRWFNVLFVEFFPGGDQAASVAGLRRLDERLLVFAPQVEGRVPVRAYSNIPPIHSLVNRLYCDQITAIAEKQKPPSVILVNFAHDFPEIMDVALFKHKIYVCFDEWPRMWRRATRPFGPKYYYHSRLYQFYENQVARRADRCLASHIPLEEKLKRVNPKTTLFLHGHEFEGTPELTPQQKPGSTIKVGFMGYITFNLLDDWLAAAADAPDFHLSLIGPVDKFNLEPFLKRRNCSHVPPLSNQSLMNKLAEMDVLIMPYDPRIPEVHVQTVSNKFFQYVAAGRPVVISDMPHYIEMPKGVIYRAKTAAEFVEKIRQARAEDCPEFFDLRLRIAEENTWDKRGDALYSLIQQDMREKGMKTEDGRQRTEDGGRKTEGGGRRAEGGGRRAEGGGRRAEDGGRKTEDGGRSRKMEHRR